MARAILNFNHHHLSGFVLPARRGFTTLIVSIRRVMRFNLDFYALILGGSVQFWTIRMGKQRCLVTHITISYLISQLTMFIF